MTSFSLVLRFLPAPAHIAYVEVLGLLGLAAASARRLLRIRVLLGYRLELLHGGALWCEDNDSLRDLGLGAAKCVATARDEVQKPLLPARKKVRKTCQKFNQEQKREGKGYSLFYSTHGIQVHQHCP